MTAPTTLPPGSALDARVAAVMMGHAPGFFPLSGSYEGLGVMLAWLQDQGYDIMLHTGVGLTPCATLSTPHGVIIPSGYWEAVRRQGESLPHAVALCVVAVGVKEDTP